MPDPKFAIVFRNSYPRRSPIGNELHLLRPDGSGKRIQYSNEGEFREASVADQIRRFHWLESLL